MRRRWRGSARESKAKRSQKALSVSIISFQNNLKNEVLGEMRLRERGLARKATELREMYHEECIEMAMTNAFLL